MNSQLLNRCPLVVRKLHISSALSATKPSPLVDSIIRVDHAGELGADRIYAGQMAVLGCTKSGPLIQHMWDQEKEHKATFEKLIVKHRVRPTVLVPIWNVAGFLLGAGTALMGEKAAMACTVAVESVIVDHYNDQLRELMAEPEKNKELMETIQKFRDDEQEHHDTGIDHGAEQAPFYKALSETIKLGCKAAIALSKELFSHRNQYNHVFCRSYSTVSVSKELQKKWDLYSAVCLERKPVIIKPLTELERRVSQMFLEMEVEKSFKSDHEIKMEEDAKTAELLKTNPEAIDLNLVLQQTRYEFEELSNKEFDEFQFSPLTTPDDKENNVKSVNRKLSSHLLLLVEEKVGLKNRWVIPHGIRKESETMRETAERVLREKCGDNLKVLFLGNAPCGFYKWKYPKQYRTESLGGKMFIFKAMYLSGQVDLQKACLDFQWSDRNSLKLLLNNGFCRKLMNVLIDENDEKNYEKRKSMIRNNS